MIVFVSPTCVGKSCISKMLEKNLKLNRVDFDTVLMQNEVDGKKGILKLFEKCVSSGCNLFDIGGNTITNFNQTEVRDLMRILGRDAVVYNLLPTDNRKQNRTILRKMISLFRDKKHQDFYRSILDYDLKSKTYKQIQTEPTHYVLGKEIVLTNNIIANYVKSVEEMGKTIIDELK